MRQSTRSCEFVLQHYLFVEFIFIVMATDTPLIAHVAAPHKVTTYVIVLYKFVTEY